MPHRHKGMNEGGEQATLTFLIYDILETNFGDWFTIRQITSQVQLLRPDASRDTVNRIVWRLTRKDIIEIDRDEKKGTRFRVAWRDYIEAEATA